MIVPRLCEFAITTKSDCPFKAQLKITRPNPVDPNYYPVYLCYSHTGSFIKNSEGQLLIEKIKS